jgi:predicted nucleotide-binding protein (sugar kinase/HSP70/actin superfamily)
LMFCVSRAKPVGILARGSDADDRLAPFTYTPEIVAVTVLPRLARDYDVPLQALSFDEHSGQAGLVTRLEAFVDLLERRAMRRGPGSSRSAYRDLQTEPNRSCAASRVMIQYEPRPDLKK